MFIYEYKALITISEETVKVSPTASPSTVKPLTFLNAIFLAVKV